MTVLVVEHRGAEITGWRYEADDEYDPDDGEMTVDQRAIDHRNLDVMSVDTGVEPPTLVTKPDNDPGSGLERIESGQDDPLTGTLVRRIDVSDETRDAFERARENGDLQAQIDSIYEILTGEVPEGSETLPGDGDAGRLRYSRGERYHETDRAVTR